MTAQLESELYTNFNLSQNRYDRQAAFKNGIANIKNAPIGEP